MTSPPHTLKTRKPAILYASSHEYYKNAPLFDEGREMINGKWYRTRVVYRQDAPNELIACPRLSTTIPLGAQV